MPKKSTGTSAFEPVEDGVGDGRTIGIAIHRLIARLSEAGVRTPTPIELIEAVRCEDLPNQVRFAPNARQRLLTGAAIYFRLYAEDQWSLIGSEVKAGRSRLDLLWRRPDGQLVADELKSGRVGIEIEHPELDAQVSRQLKDGRSEFGEEFAGTRVLFFHWPRLSFHATPDGARELLFPCPEADDA